MTGEKDPRDVMQAEHDARLSEHPAFRAPAEMPGGEERAFNLAARAMQRRFGASGTEEDIEAALSEFFAPILAEKEAAEEQAESFKAMYRQAVDWRDEKIAKLTTRAEDAEFAMSRVEKSAASAEARALAAEAALTEIARQDEIEIALDPDWPRRIASAALEKIAAPGAAMEAP